VAASTAQATLLHVLAHNETRQEEDLSFLLTFEQGAWFSSFTRFSGVQLH